MGSSATTTATFCAVLVDEWLQCGVRHAVVSPGSRSTPMALAIISRPEIETHIFHDERSASFAALGIGKASGVPAILLCTSGTAAVEYHAAIVEAHHSEVPMLVCTADRPPELQGVGAPQTIDQRNLFGAAVRKFADVGVADDGEKNSWRKLASDFFASAIGATETLQSGAVHLNLKFREPLVGESESLPTRTTETNFVKDVGTISKSDLKKILRLIDNENGLIVAGPEVYAQASVLNVAEKLNWPILADPRSAMRVAHQSVVAASDSILRNSKFAESHKPKVILRLGSPPASKVVNAWLASSGATQIVLTTTPTLIDPERRTDLHVCADIDEVCQEIVADVTSSQKSEAWLKTWSQAEFAAQTAINESLMTEPFLTEPAIARLTCSLLPEPSHLFVSSSMPIRDVEWFGAPRTGLSVHANRGVNGIDGVVSTAVGVALATKQTTCLLIGDIALLHDANGLINLMSRKIDLRIVVIDNNGGGIFSFLPQAKSLEHDVFERVFGTPHAVDLELLAQAHHIPVETVNKLEAFAEAIAQRGPFIIRVATDRKENVNVHERINQSVSAAVQRF